ncbi:hypothetical protein O2V13_004352 [Vibrio parahaemolyticus]|nr:hypothetical protein [Vibrio parahaemolyticus]EKG2489123.1 hypothetical protein [Vibrio parahaemolyticus]MCQ9070969.1 hypothetical protein [Vibrio alginolyticus]
MPTSYDHQLDTLFTRFNFHFTKGEINKVFSNMARSKPDFKSNVVSVIHSNQGLKDKLSELGLLALQLDTRQVEVFNIADTNVQGFLGLLFSNLPMTTERLISDAFPFPIEDINDLRRLATGTIYPVLSDTVTFGQDVYNRLVVSTVVDKEIEEAVPASHLSSTGQAQQNANTTYIMKRKVRTQLFHVVYWCPALSRLILSVDRNTLSLTASQDQLFVLRQFLMGKNVDCGIAINVFGAIAPLYTAPDGFITKIGHVTTDGNPVRIPLRGKQKCLKKDHYHKTGEDGGYVHAKFAISKKWEFAQAGTTRVVDVEVGLTGQPKLLDNGRPLSDFSVIKPKRLEDLDFAIGKVLSHIPTV